jgi:TRAP-type mannitol/chloroaromatic compound transport system permease small subunit
MTTAAAHSSHILRLANTLNGLCRFVGRTVAWLTVVMVIVMAVIVAQRYWFSTGSIRLQESITFMHASVFMLAAAYTLGAGGHVRVDIFYGSMRPERQAIVDIVGTLLLLLPFCGFLIWSSWDYVTTSWLIQESSQRTGGLPYPFPAILKSFIPLTAILLSLQGIAMMLEAWQILLGHAKQEQS